MESYLIDITTWLFLFIILSPINLPLTRKLLPNLADRGWVFSKIIAILLIGYFSWLLGMLKLVPFSQTSIFLLLVILAVINFFIQKNSKKPWFSKLPLKIIILEEVVFSIGFIFWSLVRSHNPDIHDLEKLLGLTNVTVNSAQAKLLQTITRFNVAGRYTEEKSNLYTIATKKYCSQYLVETKQLFIWLRNKY